MDLYNGALLNLCRQYKLECYDLASFVPKDTSVFYDDAHFNESGARIIAQLISNYLLSTPPFDQAGRLVSGQKQGK
jgi:hypothetical protein